MPETYGLPEPEPTREERAAALAREVISGAPNGAVRRILLYIIVATSGLIAIYLGGIGGAVLGLIAITALLLLGFTDQLA